MSDSSLVSALILIINGNEQNYSHSHNELLLSAIVTEQHS